MKNKAENLIKIIEYRDEDIERMENEINELPDGEKKDFWNAILEDRKEQRGDAPSSLSEKQKAEIRKLATTKRTLKELKGE